MGGILKRSLGMAFRRQTMPKGCAFEPATLNNRKPVLNEVEGS
jgi:hypothetical protein